VPRRPARDTASLTGVSLQQFVAGSCRPYHQHCLQHSRWVPLTLTMHRLFGFRVPLTLRRTCRRVLGRAIAHEIGLVLLRTARVHHNRTNTRIKSSAAARVSVSPRDWTTGE
jgi:hypothetical protein